MSCQLQTLPVEIIQLIFDGLQTSDLCSLRLVCRTVNKASFKQFGTTGFATIKTDLTPNSLQRLQNISETRDLAHYVKTLHITYHPLDDCLGRGFLWRRDSLGHLESHLPCIEMLQDILTHGLHKCRSIYIESDDEYEVGDGIEALTPSDAAGIIMTIVRNAGIRLESFTLQASHGGTGRLETKRLVGSSGLGAESRAAWADCQEMRLNYSVSEDQSDWVLGLIASTTSLRILSLKFDVWDTERLMNNLCPATLNSRLESFTLHGVHASEEILVRLLQQHRNTLRTLALISCWITGGGTWAGVFHSMTGEFPHMENLSFLHLKEEKPGTGRVYSFFLRSVKAFTIPGSQERNGNNSTLRYDRRLLRSMKTPVKSRYKGRSEHVMGVSYCGSEIDLLLAALSETAYTSTSPQ